MISSWKASWSYIVKGACKSVMLLVLDFIKHSKGFKAGQCYV